MDWLDIKEFIKDTVKYVLFIASVLFIAIYVISLQQVVGSSMAPTLNNGDVLILDKLSPKFINLKRGDIVSFYYDDSKFLVKRIIGLPGETVEIKDNKIYINNEIIEDYINNIEMDDFKLEDTVPQNSYFVLGDNRNDSLDSRDSRVGFVKKDDIIGKKFIRIWPLFK